MLFELPAQAGVVPVAAPFKGDGLEIDEFIPSE
jgi:hypothetical protein